MAVAALKKNADLKRAIQSSGQTQKALASRIGFPEKVLSWVVIGRWNLNRSEKMRVARALRMPVATLFD